MLTPMTTLESMAMAGTVLRAMDTTGDERLRESISHVLAEIEWQLDRNSARHAPECTRYVAPDSEFPKSAAAAFAAIR